MHDAKSSSKYVPIEEMNNEFFEIESTRHIEKAKEEDLHAEMVCIRTKSCQKGVYKDNRRNMWKKAKLESLKIHGQEKGMVINQLHASQ